MNSAAELKRFEENNQLQKAKQKVIDALANDPMGLSISQLMTVCKLSIKTVKNVLSNIETDQEQGVFFLKNAPQAIIENKPQVPKIQVEAKNIVAKAVTTTEAINVNEAILNLLNSFPEGLNKADIKNKLNITDKQFSNFIFKLNQAKKITRTGKLGHYKYKLATKDIESPSLVVIPDVEAEKLKIENDHETLNTETVITETWKEFCESPVIKPTTQLEVFKSRIKTVVTHKSELSLEQDQLTELLTDLFGLSQVSWYIEGSRLLGVRLSDEVVV